jgi:hypothetical protein
VEEVCHYSAPYDTVVIGWHYVILIQAGGPSEAAGRSVIQ